MDFQFDVYVFCIFTLIAFVVVCYREFKIEKPNPKSTSDEKS